MIKTESPSIRKIVTNDMITEQILFLEKPLKINIPKTIKKYKIEKYFKIINKNMSPPDSL